MTKAIKLHGPLVISGRNPGPNEKEPRRALFRITHEASIRQRSAP